MFKNLDYLSDSLQEKIKEYLIRIDVTQRDREIFCDIIGESFTEGISSKTQIKNSNHNGEEK